MQHKENVKTTCLLLPPTAPISEINAKVFFGFVKGERKICEQQGNYYRCPKNLCLTQQMGSNTEETHGPTD